MADEDDDPPQDAEALVGNAADEAQVKHAGRVETRREKRRAKVLQSVMSTYDGREFVWSEIRRHKIFDSITALDNSSFLDNGRRNAGVDLLAEVIRLVPDLYLNMHAEAIDRDVRLKQEREAVRATRATTQ